jgi:hypothetical protein
LFIQVKQGNETALDYFPDKITKRMISNHIQLYSQTEFLISENLHTIIGMQADFIFYIFFKEIC